MPIAGVDQNQNPLGAPCLRQSLTATIHCPLRRRSPVRCFEDPCLSNDDERLHLLKIACTIAFSAVSATTWPFCFRPSSSVWKTKVDSRLYSQQRQQRIYIHSAHKKLTKLITN